MTVFKNYAQYIDHFRKDFEHRGRRDFTFEDITITLFPGIFPSDSPYTFSTQSLILSLKKDIDSGAVSIEKNYRIIDLCTASGVIAVYIKKHLPNSTVLASDIDDAALKNAEYNFKKLGLDVQAVKSDFFKNIEGQFDYIVSSIPFVDDWQTVPPGQQSLYTFWKTAGDYLKDDGMIYFNWADWADFELAEKLATDNGFNLVNFDEYDLPIGQYKWQTYRFNKKL